METTEKKLNKRERYKAQKKPIEYYKEFDTIDFESLNEADRFYLQDFGIFNVEHLEDEFTIRIRNSGGQMSSDHFKQIGLLAKEYALQPIITARGGIQFHGITSENVHKIHKKVNDIGVTTWQSFGDNVRNIVCDIYDGVGKYAHIEVYPIVMQIHNLIIHNPKYVGMLPRRLGVAISGNSANVTSLFANDIVFLLAKKGEDLGFNVYLGGKNTDVAKSADLFLYEDEVFSFFKAFAEAFYDHGSRYTRSRTRVFHLIEDIGMQALKDLISPYYGKEYRSEGVLVLEQAKFEEFHPLKDGTYAYCYQTYFSKLSPDEMTQIAEFVEHNNLSLRIGMDQKIYILGLKEKIAPFSSKAISQTVTACAGNLCPYAVWSIKDETAYLPLDRINTHQIHVGFSGCAKGCGRHKHVDIGLIGLKTNNFGDVEGGARVFIGSLHTYGLSESRQLFSMVPFPHLHDAISMVIDLFELSGYSIFEEFSQNVINRYSEDFVSLWVLANLESQKRAKFIEQNSSPDQETQLRLLRDEFGDLDFWEHLEGEDLYPAISYLSKKLWTIEGADPTYKPPIERTVFR